MREYQNTGSECDSGVSPDGQRNTTNKEQGGSLKKIGKTFAVWFFAAFFLASCAAKPKMTEIAVEPANYRESTIAVLNFENNSPHAEWDYMKSAIAEIISANLANYPSFKIVERERLNKVLEELSLSETGLIDADTAVRIGRILGADAILMGSVTQLGKTLVLSSRIVDVETAQILSGQAASGEKEEELNNIVTALVGKIAASLK